MSMLQLMSLVVTLAMVVVLVLVRVAVIMMMLTMTMRMVIRMISARLGNPPVMRGHELPCANLRIM